jgi:hypothetical protein
MFGVMEFMTFAPPDVTSALIHSGPGAESLQAVEPYISWLRTIVQQAQQTAASAQATNTFGQQRVAGQTDAVGRENRSLEWMACRPARMRGIETIDSEL